jgi:hypothetical protein
MVVTEQTRRRPAQARSVHVYREVSATSALVIYHNHEKVVGGRGLRIAATVFG